MIHKGNANAYAVRSQQEVADILFARGLIPKPCRKIIQWAERHAFEKIRAAAPELAAEIEDERRGVRGVERVY